MKNKVLLIIRPIELSVVTGACKAILHPFQLFLNSMHCFLPGKLAELLKLYLMVENRILEYRLNMFVGNILCFFVRPKQMHAPIHSQLNFILAELFRFVI